MGPSESILDILVKPDPDLEHNPDGIIQSRLHHKYD